MNQTIYTIHKYIDGSLEPFNDGSHLIYINGSAQDDGTEIWKLIHDLRCTNADEMFREASEKTAKEIAKCSGLTLKKVQALASTL